MYHMSAKISYKCCFFLFCHKGTNNLMFEFCYPYSDNLQSSGLLIYVKKQFWIVNLSMFFFPENIYNVLLILRIMV